MTASQTAPEINRLTRSRLADAADIHSHPLPGIDDGAKTIQDSIHMLRCAARYGTSLMVATPHRWYDGRENKPDLLRKLTAQVQAALAKTRFAHRIQLLPGQEIPLRPETADELAEGRVLTLADNGIYALVEPPFESLSSWTAEALAAIIAKGFQPVFAHPERNDILQVDPTPLHDFVAAGAHIQLTAMSVMGRNGERAQKTAFWIIEQGLVSVVASDTHSPSWRPPSVRDAFHILESRYGGETARRLCSVNPRAIATGQEIKRQV